MINLRGSIIPIVDLRKRLNLNVTEQTTLAEVTTVAAESKVIVEGDTAGLAGKTISAKVPVA